MTAAVRTELEDEALGEEVGEDLGEVLDDGGDAEERRRAADVLRKGDCASAHVPQISRPC